MALDKVLKVYDDNGNEIDYDILAKDVKFLPDGKDLPTKLAELEDEIGEGGYAPPAGGIPKTDLAESVQDSLDNADSAVQPGDDIPATDVTGLAPVATSGSYNDLKDKPTIPDTSNLATKTELNTKQDTLVAGNGIAIAQDGKTVSVAESIRTNAGKGVADVSSPQEDGSFTITLANGDTYTVNLNHSHEGMAKLENHTPATMPDVEDMEEDTIYAEVEDGEVNVLYIGGVPFYGGGSGTSIPVLRQPADDSTIDVGKIESGESSVTKTITVKGKNLTQALTVAVTGTGYSVNKQTISAADANVGTTLTITCTSTAEEAAGTLSLASSEVSCDCDLVANLPVWEDLSAVKFTGTQGLQTDYTPNPNTEFELDMKFETNANTDRREGFSGGMSSYIFQCNIVDNNAFYFNTTGNESDSYELMCRNDKLSDDIIKLSFLNNRSAMLQRGIMSYKKNANSKMTWSFNGVSDATLPLKTGSPGTLNICYVASTYNLPTNRWNVYIYGLKIMENGVVVRNYKPVTRNGVAGLYDTIHNTFISSNGNDELVAIP